MARIRLILSILLGLIYFVFGLNGFFHFINMPPPPEAAMNLFGAFMQSGYMFPLIKGTEVVCGFLLLTGLYVPLALVVLAPISLNIILFHAYLAPEGIPLAAGIVIIHLVLGFLYRAQYAPILKARA